MEILQRMLDCDGVTLTDAELLHLSERVKPYLTEKRYAHTAAVAAEAARLGELFGFAERDIGRLRASAWLHDITKRADTKKQLKYCEEFGIIIEPERSPSPKILHGMTAAPLAARDFPEYTDRDILSGIRWHTTGRYNMTLFEAIVYLADYIEPTRTFDDCIAVRRYFYERISPETSMEERYSVLADTMCYSFDLTIESLLEARDYIDSDTICARNYFIALL